MDEACVKTKQRDNLGNLLIALSCLVYFSSYVMRYSYTVSMAHIIEVTSLTETQAGMIGTALFFAYGSGQIVSGFLGDKLKPNLLILAGIIVGTVCNVIFPLYNSVVYYVVIWGINGFAQAMIWPPLIKIMSEKLSPEKCSTGIVLVSVAANLATLTLYLVIPQILSALGYESVFYISGAISGLMGIVWGVGYAFIHAKRSKQAAGQNPEVAAESAKRTDVTNKTLKILPMMWGSGLIFVMVAMVMQGFLRDGITSWFPSYVSDTFNIASADSIFLTAALSLMSIISIYVFKWIYRRFCHNEVTISLLSFAVIALLSLLLYFFSVSNIAFTVICGSIVAGISHGINYILTCIAPHFARFGITSRVAGIINACTYVGSALSMYLFALIAELFGWQTVVLCWVIIAGLGIAACVLSVRRWKSFLSGTEVTAPEDAAVEPILSETEPEGGQAEQKEENDSKIA